MLLSYCKGRENGRIISSGEVAVIRNGGVVRVVNSVRSGLPSSSDDNNSTGQVDLPYVPQEGKIEIISKDPQKKVSDVVEFKVKDKGFTFTPGVKIAWPNYLGVDVKYVYYKMVGLETGVGYNFYSKRTDLDTGLSVHLDWLLPVKNTEIYCGYGFVTKTIYTGLRINL